MTDFNKGIIDLVKSGLTGEVIILPENFDFDAVYTVAVRHQITALIYYGALNSKINLPADIKLKLETAVFSSIAASTKQTFELQKIFKVFEENNIEFMPLKGAVIKYLFPKPEMRQMGDADILIKLNQYDKIKPIMQSLGFTEKIESDHELVWIKKGALLLELHKRLIPSYNKDYYAYFGDGWQLAQKTDTSRYELLAEDNLIYLFTHFSKHYRDGGIGIRHLVDFKVYLDNNQKLDKKYIEAELKKLQLLDFYNNAMDTLAVWFDNKTPTDITDAVTDKIFGSGPYGTHKDHIISAAVKTSKTVLGVEGVKKKKLFGLIFPSAKALSQKYVILKKYPVLLPAIWVVRWFDAVFIDRSKITKQQSNLSLITDESVSKYQKQLNFVGLDFNFKE